MPGLVTVFSAILVLLCGRTHTHTDAANRYTRVGVSNKVKKNVGCNFVYVNIVY